MSTLPFVDKPVGKRVLMLSPDAQMIDRRILQEARTLAANGYDVTVLSGFECKRPDAYETDGYTVKRYVYDWTDPRRDALRERLGAVLARAAWQPARIMNRLQGGLTAYESYVLQKALSHRFDVVHVHDYPMLAVGAEAARRRGATLFYDSHEFYSAQSVLPVATQKRYRLAEGRLIRHCDVVVTVNPYLAAMFAKVHGIAEPSVILNAAERLPSDTETTSDGRRQHRVALGLPPDDILILYQGWISSERNLEPMIAAMANLPRGSTLVIVGYGDHLATLRDLAKAGGVSDRVLFYGRVESEDLPAVTRLCDLGIVPYRAVDEMHRYCSPNKLFEYIAAGLPILASDLPYLRDVIGGYGIGWLADLESAADFSAALSGVIGDREALAVARQNVPKAAADLNWDVEGQKLLTLYARMLGTQATSTNSRPVTAGSISEPRLS